MALCGSRIRGDGDGLRRSIARIGAIVGVALVVAGCSQGLAAWRSLKGLNADDPNPKTAPFTGNMANAYDQPYPNLASVPPPPTVETSTAERQKLAQTLIAERNATAVSGGSPSPAAVPAKPPAQAKAAAAPAARVASAGAARAAANAKPPSRRAPPHRPGEAPAPQPLNSSLAMPTIPGPLPQPQTPQPPPTAPVLAAVAPVPVAPMASLAAASSAMVQPPLPPPALPAIAALPTPLPGPAKRPPAITVATLDIAAAVVADKAQIAHVAALYKQQPRRVLVVAFAAAPAPGTDPLRLYDAALDRAQKVAKALAAAGIPAAHIETEANPSSGRQIGRVEIQFAP